MLFDELCSQFKMAAYIWLDIEREKKARQVWLIGAVGRVSSSCATHVNIEECGLFRKDVCVDGLGRDF